MDKSLLSRALADTEEPTPGYMYRDIVKWTFLDQTTQTKLIKALMDRLKSNATVHVLTKTLKMVRHLCENGHIDFQKEMQGKNETLKQFASYRGTQDAKFGDKLNERVRAAAKEAVDSAFAPRKAQKINIDSGSGSNTGTHDTKVQEKSTGGFSTGNTVNNSSGKTGDGRIADMPTGNKWAEHMAKGGGVVKEEGGSGFGGSVKNAYSTSFGMVKENLKTNEQRMNEKLHDTGEYQAVDIGAGFGGGGGGFGNDKSGGSGSGWKFTDETSSSAPVSKEIRMITPLQKEVERVAAFKNTPQRVEVSLFCETIAKIVAESEGSHSYEDLAEAMDASISQKHPWQVRLNVLCCIEGVARSKVSSEFNSYFLENPEDIQRNMHVVQGSLKERAQKVLKLLGIPERTAGAGTTVAQQVTSCTSQGETTWAAPVAANVFTEAPSGNDGGGDIDFGGMSETAPRRKKVDKAGAKGDKTVLKKRSAMTSAQDETSSGGGGWGESGGGGGGWGTSETTTSGGGGWGDSTPASNGAGDGWGAPSQQQAPPQQQQAPPPAQASKVDDMDMFFGAAPLTQKPAQGPPPGQQQQQPAWGAEPAPQKEPVWGGNSSGSTPQSSFDPLSLPGPMNGSPQPQQNNSGNGAGADQTLTQRMTFLNNEVQRIMATAATNPRATEQVQNILQQQQQLMQTMHQGGGNGGGGGMQQYQQQGQSRPPVLTQQQQYQQQQAQQKKADDQFAFAAQQMRTQLKK